MDPEIKLLIDYYEREKRLIQKSFRQDKSDGDYAFAENYMQIIYDLDNKINDLKKLDDPLYNQKKSIESEVQMCRSALKRQKGPELQEFYRERVKKGEAKLRELNEKPYKPLSVRGDLDELIFDVVEKKIRSFSLPLAGGEIAVKVSLPEEGQILISLSSEDEDMIEEYYIEALGKAGLSLDRNTGEFICRYYFNKFNSTTEVKMMLARIVIGMFSFDPGTTLNIVVEDF